MTENRAVFAWLIQSHLLNLARHPGVRVRYQWPAQLLRKRPKISGSDDLPEIASGSTSSTTLLYIAVTHIRNIVHVTQLHAYNRVIHAHSASLRLRQVHHRPFIRKVKGHTHFPACLGQRLLLSQVQGKISALLPPRIVRLSLLGLVHL